MRKRFCNGSDTARFIRGQRRVRRNNTSTSLTCRRQWHFRIWGDYAVNSRREWSIGVVYRETRPSFSRGHRINQAWESSEEILTFEMIRKR